MASPFFRLYELIQQESNLILVDLMNKFMLIWTVHKTLDDFFDLNICLIYSTYVSVIDNVRHLFKSGIY